MGGEDDFNRLLTTLYASATDPQSWAAGLSSLTEFAAGSGMVYLLSDKTTHSAFSVMTNHYGEDLSRRYVEHYARHDIVNHVAARAPIGQFFSCTDFISEETVRRNPFYNEFFMPTGSRYISAVRLIETERFLVTTGIHRSLKQGPFVRREIERLQLVSDHLVQASQLLHRFLELRAAHAQTSAALRKQDGVRARHGKIEAGTAEQTSALHRLIHHAAASSLTGSDGRGGGSLAFARSSGLGQLAILVSPLLETEATHGLFTGRRGAILFITDPHQPSITPVTLLMQLFGLTKAEAAVAASLAAGKSVGEIAEETGVSRNTVRVQTQSVLGKTGTRRQAELVRLLLSLPNARPESPP
jgi:DNA-binding CsgD family transcriptional regulator